MGTFWRQLRQPVKREHADVYLRWVLISFAAAVIGMRWWLELTNYPQIGPGSLHIAHVLWGGLILFFGALLPLVFANRASFTASAILAGMGMGLFVDEVGKFITDTNDYFYAPALPIIYAFFLLTTFFYVRLRRPPSMNVKAELYRALDGFSEVLESDLNPEELASLKKRLRYVQNSVTDPNLERLAGALLASVENASFTTVEDAEDWWERLLRQLQAWENRLFSQFAHRTFLLGVFLVGGITAIVDAVQALVAFFSATARIEYFEELIASGDIAEQNAFGWFVIRLVLEGIAGVVLLLAAWLFVRGKEKMAVNRGSLALMFYLTTANLLVFYFDQVQAFISTLIQLSVFFMVRRYRKRFLHVISTNVNQEIEPIKQEAV